MKKYLITSLIILFAASGLSLAAIANLPPDYYETCNVLRREIVYAILKLDEKYMEIQSITLIPPPLSQEDEDELKKLEADAKTLEAEITSKIAEYQNNNCDMSRLPPRPLPPAPIPGVQPVPAPLPPGAPLPPPAIPGPGGGINPVQ